MREGIITRLLKYLVDLALKALKALIQLIIKVLEEILRRIGL